MIEGQHIHHQLKFLPPYSPQLNPIELMFSSWKAALKNIEVSRINEEHKNLLNLIEEASTSVKDANKAAGWYRHVTRHYIHCAASKPLDEKYNPNTLVAST